MPEPTPNSESNPTRSEISITSQPKSENGPDAPVTEKKSQTELPPEIEQSLAESPQKWVRTPPIDIYETEDGLVLRADLPGVAPDALELQVQDNRLTLFGHVSRSVVEGATLIHEEYHEGDFLRSFILSDDVDHDRISAKLADGVLEVQLPRTPRSKPRKISVETG